MRCFVPSLVLLSFLGSIRPFYGKKCPIRSQSFQRSGFVNTDSNSFLLLLFFKDFRYREHDVIIEFFQVGQLLVSWFNSLWYFGVDVSGKYELIHHCKKALLILKLLFPARKVPKKCPLQKWMIKVH